MDNAIWPWRGRQWAHLVSDTSHDELHGFAALLGIPRRGFQGDHYDVPADLRERAIALGAQAVASALETRGITRERIETVGRGKNFPVASNDTVAGRQANRRVEIVFSNEKGNFASSGAAAAAN